MSYCGPRGIPLSQFESWSQEDQDAALAWQINDSTRCSGCGAYSDEYFDSDGIPLDPLPYEIATTACGYCRDIEAHRKMINDPSVSLRLAPRGTVRRHRRDEDDDDED